MPARICSCLLILVTVAATAVVVTTSSVQAATAAPIVINSPMSVQAVSKVGTPKPDGDVDVTLQNGRVIQVSKQFANLVAHPTPPTSSSGSGVHTDSTVYGNCGSSYINLAEKSNGWPVQMYTGFHTKDASISYHWNAGIGGPRYQYNYGSSGGLSPTHNWNGQHHSTDDYPSGQYFASVSTSSYALLYWGGICTSGGPVTSAYL
jgi:hypothetical protein